MPAQSQYIFGKGSEFEFQRLARQGELMEPVTRRVFEMAGIATGMRVLDMGCGVGEVARIAADLAGPTGHVTAVDTDGSALQFARQRHAGRNIEFVQSQVEEYAPGKVFDAVVGRFILMHVKDPVAVIRQAASHTRSGGVVCFVEPWHGTAMSYPRVEAFHAFMEGGYQAFRAAGIHMELGGRLYGDFVAAGLPAPALHIEAAGGAGNAKAMFDLMLDSARSGIRASVPEAMRDAALAQVEGLAQQMRADATEKNATMLMMLNVGAWSRKP